MTENTCFLGIDPGLSGGIAVIGTILTTAERTPIIEGDKRTMNLPAVASLIRRFVLANGGVGFAVIEKVGCMPGQGITSAWTFGKGYGSFLGILATLDIPLQEVPAQRWKKEMLDGADKSDKASSINRAISLFPQVNLITAGRRVPSDGMAEALLIAEYGRRMYQGVKK
jgi:crossover junction endodeoxyribonuclease RuvC